MGVENKAHTLTCHRVDNAPMRPVLKSTKRENLPADQARALKKPSADHAMIRGAIRSAPR
jgi:hypothetical protein